MPHLSKKGIELPTSPIRKLVIYSEQAKEKGIEVLHLNIGQPDIAAPKEAIEAVTNSKLNLKKSTVKFKSISKMEPINQSKKKKL